MKADLNKTMKSNELQTAALLFTSEVNKSAKLQYFAPLFVCKTSASKLLFEKHFYPQQKKNGRNFS